MSDATGRTGFRVTHTKAVGERRAIVHEMMRELDPKAVEYWAAQNTNIVVEDEVLDLAYVNNGDGKFRRAKSMDEVIDYGQSRLDKLSSPLKVDKPDKKGKPRGGTVTSSMFVAHLPKSMCTEVKDFYGKGRSRWIARDRDEAIKYFADVVKFLRTNVIPGGTDAILGFDMQFSETTPHIQILADTFAPDPKHPDQLRPEWSRAYAVHRDLRDGNGKMITGKVKLAHYQDEMKAFMVARGWPVEREVDPLRHDKSETKAVYGALRDERRELDGQREQLKAERDELIRDGEDLEREEFRVSFARKQVETERETAREGGRREGYEQGLSEAKREREAAREELTRARALMNDAALHLRSVEETPPLAVGQGRRFFRDGVQLLANDLKKRTNDRALIDLIEKRSAAYTNYADTPKFVEYMNESATLAAPVRERQINRQQADQRRLARRVVELNESPSMTAEHEDGMSL